MDVAYVPHFDGGEVAGYFVIVVEVPENAPPVDDVREIRRSEAPSNS